MTKKLHELIADHEFTVFVNDVRELKMRLEAGYRVEYKYAGGYVISQKRGQEYVTVSAQSEEQAKSDWDALHERGYYVDPKTMARVSVPGAR